MSKIVDFYRNENVHPRGFLVEDIHTWNDSKLENIHDYIQWVFPLNEPSAAQPQSPVLTSEDIQIMSNDSVVRWNILIMFTRMLNFYGIEIQSDKFVLVNPKPHWLKPYDHNFLRLTRIMKSLNLLGFTEHASALQKCLLQIAKDNPYIIYSKTRVFWEKAI
jgi:hypothetical protein